MFSTKKGQIALISVHGDPAVKIGKEEAGGQNVYVKQVGEALAKQGWQVDMFTRRAEPTQEAIVEHSPGCRTIRLTAGPQKFVGRNKLFDYLPEFVEAFLSFQQQEGIVYPLVHTNYWLSSWVGMELRKRQPIKQIHTYHSLGAVKYQASTTVPLIASTRLSIEKTCLETVDCVVATSPQERDHMRSLVSTKGNIDIIPCGTDIRRFGAVDRQTARQQLGISPETKVVLYVGRFDPRKGIETLVRAVNYPEVRQHSDFKLMIAGGSRPGQSDGDERERIEGIVNELELGDRTEFVGRLDHTQLPTYYAAADVCVVPSHYEPFGLVAIEAMASGTPVVASDVGGLQFTVVPEETGLLAPAQDEAAFAAAIGRILADPTWRDQLSKASRQRVEARFSWDGVASQLSELYLSHLSQLHNEFFSASVS
ncbi:glycosyltransferase family 1 protein [Leptolyngbya sp. FACHB-671]|uniref:glycosyltransferase family 4 protein n=1 Tax=Leptolyngbya sp. FACHB-671 TaxID=2692812 RepID=UPI001687FD6D|nr:glycosyltransferase family 1 protein [Leptolyngbya sp. FACHB-671]MBD1871388.1 glycosyltransferase family 1 protein [Cyanobacteria bacterium FACHB-471]MBD2072064.1 glycosyltransferase family 1 protein [Leptolyngbya sp. FACHB-671]